jgi:glutamate dehydrogenase (NAD(P)+)
MRTKPNPYEVAQQQFDLAADVLELDQAVRDLLRSPMREYNFSIPVRMDNGDVRIIRGFRVQHNDARGPCKGGIRFQPRSTIDTIRAQAMWTTWKCAVLDIPLGGSMGGFLCDPHNLSLGEQQRLCRGWVRQIAKNLGPLADVPYPETMTSAKHMLWMLDEYEVIFGGKYPGFITGKPVGLGGSRGRTESTGYGAIIALREALKELGMDIDGTRASVQGFGNVAQHAIQLFQRMGGYVTCVSSWDQDDQTSYAFRKKDGIIFDELTTITNTFGEIDKDKAQDLGYEILSGDDWIEQDVDILIPAAAGNQVSLSKVEKISKQVKIIVEAASGPTTPLADEKLKEMGLLIIPDLVANTGGVICSYYEQVQSNANYYWSKDDVLGQLDSSMTSAYMDVSDFAKTNNLKMRDAALIMAVERVALACKARGWV